MHALETGLIYLVLGIDLISLLNEKIYNHDFRIGVTSCVLELQLLSSVANSRASDPRDGSISFVPRKDTNC